MLGLKLAQDRQVRALLSQVLVVPSTNLLHSMASVE